MDTLTPQDNPYQITTEISSDSRTSTPARELVFFVIKLCFIAWLLSMAITLVLAKTSTGVFFDPANWIIHELGHILFLCFTFFPVIGDTIGKFLYVLGGTLLQVAVPVICLIYFWFSKRWFSTAFCLFWLGDNLVNIHFYIADSHCRCLPLYSLSGEVGPEGHDWHYLLSSLGILQYDGVLAQLVMNMAILFFIVAFIWMFWESIQRILAQFSRNKASL